MTDTFELEQGKLIMNRQIILIGGAPTTGKSTVARALAKKLDLPWLSADQIRDAMRVVAAKRDYPDLFNAGLDAEKFLTRFTAEEIVDKEIAQSKAAWLGVKAFIEHDYTWPEGFIIEGVNILPQLVAADFGANTQVQAIFLVDHNQDRMRKVIYERGLWGDAHTYPDTVKEKEVEWSTLFGKRLEAEAKKHGYPYIEVHKSDEDTDRVLAVLRVST